MKDELIRAVKDKIERVVGDVSKELGHLSNKIIKEQVVLGKTVLEFGKGGVTFQVIQDGHGVALEINSVQFGNNVCTLKILMDQESIYKLSDMLDVAGEKIVHPAIQNEQIPNKEK